MLPEYHPKIIEALDYPDHGMILDGVYASQAIDTSAEMMDIEGADISSLNKDGVLNTEHVNPSPKNGDEKATFEVLVGRVIFAKKIFKEEDCESQRELKLWQDLKLPFIYGISELFDSEGHKNAQALAAIIRHYHNRKLPLVTRYSIEGNTFKRDGNVLKQTICRRVAVTVRPCNQSAVSGLIADKEADTEESSSSSSFGKKENEVSVCSTIYNGLIEDDPVRKLKEALDEFKELTKTLTLGSYNTSPGSLTGGAALSKEQVGNRDALKAKALAAYRDWDKKKPFKEFLKSVMAEVDPDFIEKFAEMAEDYHVKLRKTEDATHDLGSAPQLSSLETKRPSGAKQYKNKWIKPGELEIIAGPTQGSKLKLMHVDDKYAYVQPFKSGDKEHDPVNVSKLKLTHENSHFRINSMPEQLHIPNYVDATKHADPVLTNSQEQQQLMHGIDLAKDPVWNIKSSPELQSIPTTLVSKDGMTGWVRSGSGKLGYVKPSVKTKTDQLLNDPDNFISTAKRETIFHNTARDYFGLGEHVPTTATFNVGGDDHSVMELVPHASHVKKNDRNSEENDRLLEAGHAGRLDKLAIMDNIMGHSDRHRSNYLTSPADPKVHLIDNSQIFNYDDHHMPEYLHDYHDLAKQPFQHSELHPEVARWLSELNPFNLNATLQKQGVPDKLRTEAVSRLVSMQSALVAGAKHKNDILFAHKKYTNPAFPAWPEVEQ